MERGQLYELLRDFEVAKANLKYCLRLLTANGIYCDLSDLWEQPQYTGTVSASRQAGHLVDNISPHLQMPTVSPVESTSSGNSGHKFNRDPKMYFHPEKEAIEKTFSKPSYMCGKSPGFCLGFSRC